MSEPVTVNGEGVRWCAICGRMISPDAPVIVVVRRGVSPSTGEHRAVCHRMCWIACVLHIGEDENRED